MWIAACCLAYEAPLATLNLKDYEDFTEHHGLRILGVKHDFACTFTSHFSPVLVALRSQSCLMPEGRARTLGGLCLDLSPARTRAPDTLGRNVPGTLRA